MGKAGYLLIFLAMLTLEQEPAVVKHFSSNDGIPAKQIRSIFQGSDGKIWVGTTRGAAYLEGGKWYVTGSKQDPISSGVPAILEDSRGRIWLGGIGSAYLFEEGSYREFSIEENMKLKGRLVFNLYEDEQKNIWAATTAGASRFDGEGWETITEENGLRNEVVHDIIEDRKGRLWFATRKGGLNIYDGNKWTYLFTDRNIRKFFKDKEGNIWAGTGKGLLKFDGSDWNTFDLGMAVLPMFQGEKGTIWATTDTEKILRIAKGDQILSYNELLGGEAKVIYHLARGSQGTILAGTDNGLFVLN